MDNSSMYINFVLPPAGITGGVLSVLEHAYYLKKLGHICSITTFPKSYWPEDWENIPYRWYKNREALIFCYYDDSEERLCDTSEENVLVRDYLTDAYLFKYVMKSIPECDINVATSYITVYPVYFSQKGKPVYFMQHYEAVWHENVMSQLPQKLKAMMSYYLPVYKVANSSWLRDEIERRFGQYVPYSNNAINNSDFSVRKKRSSEDGIIRIITFSKPRQWKGFADAVAAMKIIKSRFGDRVEWHIFGTTLYDKINIEKEGIEVKTHINITFDELSRLYAECDIVFCPSWYESFPLPPLEAMASCTAVITTRIGTEDYARDGETAIVVEARDIRGMVDALNLLICDDPMRERIARKGYEESKKFTWERAAKEKEIIFYNILKDNITYNLYTPLLTGLKDGSNVAFEHMPNDLDLKEGEFFVHSNQIFCIEDGKRRRVASPGKEEKRKVSKEISDIDFNRIPVGMPIE